jgi:hypothetical protein
MKPRPVLPEQALVCHVLGECVLEEVFEVFLVIPLTDQIGGSKCREARIKRVALRRDFTDDFIEKVPPYDGSLAQHLSPTRLQPIDASRDNATNRCRNSSIHERPRYLPRTVGTRKCPRLDQ